MIWINEADVPLYAMILIPIGLLFVLGMVFGIGFWTWKIPILSSNGKKFFKKRIQKKHIKYLLKGGLISLVIAMGFFPFIIELSLLFTLFSLWMLTIVAMKFSFISATEDKENDPIL